MGAKEFSSCSCCKRCTPFGEGLCTRCKPSEPGGFDGCRPTGYGGWRRTVRCRVRAEPAKRRVNKPKEPDGHGPTGSRKTIRCRWCTRRFQVWSRSKRTGKRVSWQPAIRAHCQRQHAFELTDWRVANPLEMVATSSDDRAQRMRLIQEAAQRLRGKR